jgi:hypothetical protein
MAIAIEVTLYALAVVGMAGVWLVPARLWTIVVKRQIGVPLSFQPTALVGAMPVLVTIAFSLWEASVVLPHVLQCLADSTRHCSANRAGGLVALSEFGFTVVIVEASWFFSRHILTVRHRQLSKSP